MRGSIKPHLKSSFKIWIEMPTVGGKRKREVLIVRGTRKEAEAKLAERISAIEAGDYSRAGNMTFEPCLRRWLVARKATLANKSYDRYEAIVNDYLVPAFGTLPVKKLTPLHIEDALNAWRLSDRKNRKPGKISPRTVHHIFSTLKSALNQLCRWNLITRNPCSAITPPSKGHTEIKAIRCGQFIQDFADVSLDGP